jgi:hypothetical protein
MSDDRLSDLLTHALIAASYASELVDLIDNLDDPEAALSKRSGDLARHTDIVAKLALEIAGDGTDVPQWTDRPRIGRRHDDP